MYENIKRRVYTEKIPCKVIKVQKKHVECLIDQNKMQLRIKRVPRIVHYDSFSADTKKTFYIETENEVEKNAAYMLLIAESKEGENAVLILTYNYFTYAELLHKAGIEEKEYQSSYNKVGSIIHLNLKDEVLKHKDIISQILLDKIKDCTTVIRKATNITGVYRNIEIEHLQGEKRYKTVHKENGLRFSISYDKVYWNSKLQKERERLAKKVSTGETVCDLFCGVGPFSILLLSKGATVWANDLNPESVKNFQESIILNRKILGVKGKSPIWNEQLQEKVYLYNLDAAEFLQKATEEHSREKEGLQLFNHYILNLPEMTLEYLSMFAELEKKAKGAGYVHAYFFLRTGDDPIYEVEKKMQRKIIAETYLVRKVSPCKEMWCVSFPLVC